MKLSAIVHDPYDNDHAEVAVLRFHLSEENKGLAVSFRTKVKDKQDFLTVVDDICSSLKDYIKNNPDLT